MRDTPTDPTPTDGSGRHESFVAGAGRQAAIVADLLRWIVLGALSGALAGLAAAVFLVSLRWATEAFDTHAALLWFLPLARYDLRGLDRATLAMPDLSLMEGRWDNTAFDASVFFQEPGGNVFGAMQYDARAE